MSQTTRLVPRTDAAASGPAGARAGDDLRTRVLFTHRDDPLAPYLGRALRAAYDVVGELEVAMPRTGRLLVAGLTLRPRSGWGERYIKSNLGLSLRSHALARRLRRAPAADVVFQTHALYRVGSAPAVVYVDCTHRQSAASWPAWNPLRGRALRRWIERERRQYQQAVHVFAFSRATRRSLVEDYGVPPQRVTVVGAGLDFDALPPRRTHRPVAPVLLFVGHDFVRKGGPELLAAFREVREQFPDATLRLVGAGVPAVDQPGVEVVGAVDDRDHLARLYAEATVFCLPSHFEPFGLVLLEAMAHGLPCVVTDTCGVPDVVVDGVTGSVLADGPGLVPDLTAALAGLLADPDAAHEQGRAGRRRVEQQFLWSHVVERMRPALDPLRPGAAGAPPYVPPTTGERP